MNVLGIETATTVCGVAVWRDHGIAASEEHNVPNTHAERLLPAIDRVLKQAGLRASQLDAVAVSIGPGSFTGLRIGLSVAKGLVFSSSAKLVSVSTLEALAYRVVNLGIDVKVLAALDARRDRVYGQLFECHGSEITPAGEIRLTPVAEFAGECGGEKLMLVGNGAHVLMNAARVLDVGTQWNIVPDEINRASATTVAFLGARQCAQGLVDDVSSAEPAYLMDFFEKR